MKNILVILLLFPTFCFSQKWVGDTTARKKDYGVYSHGEGYILKIDSTPPTPKQDTIPVMLLVCDTSFVEGLTTALLSHGLGDNLRSIYEIPNRTPAVWWQFGYEVVGGEEYYPDRMMVDEYSGILSKVRKPCCYSYLDQNKKPLSKSIVVWMSKEIQQTKTN